ncbi:hypothetical protein AC477_02950 [miscellaneous Crenarchaeota group-1 archaeon SG8-32-1]|uniref:Uncharacterized protein n=1 Tax=miscellaneous Crenarchaeota group-1 archaeon SG8-32-1 TaxID=1685124 RepID=A0A0M0BWG0_9ARCH|nr:MAG: hypothetical protein AC477_02950 [miscellaneous Crenarchaeota group-1 archaeon SG8-32-1]
MISFNISAIDIILAVTIVVLAILYLKKMQHIYPEQLEYGSIRRDVKRQDPSFDFRNIYPQNLNAYEDLDDSDDEVSVYSDSY